MRLKHIADRRKEALDVVLNDLANIEGLKRLMDGLTVPAGTERSSRVSEFLEWSQKELAAREAAFSSEGLERRFANDRVFGDEDDHSFKSPFWYRSRMERVRFRSATGSGVTMTVCFAT
ncbi:hypothetical protein LZK98_04965 [Sphingomonas cannabina]|uniref:hypothetical protein n=1 Tax=Sphingomonas cannabina TaxID=2899123 RepID=UPI001F1946F7|nr:hypothetical protein [Sphingomonas cannabina]UIJ46298.1 hypothetical protein LZK98_04965 [Sphingomonas cannabina]